MGVRSQIVAYCRKQLGCSYSYTPSGGREGASYNCSYLSTCAYKAAGLTIPKWQGHQNGDGSQSDWVYRNGHWVTNPSKLKVGDLVFFGTKRTNTGHVGIVSRVGTTPYIIDSTPSRGVAERKLPINAGFVGGGWPLKNLPVDEPSTNELEAFPMTKTITVVDDSVNVRTYPSTKKGKVVDSYARGEHINIDGVILNEGVAWGTYVGSKSGARRYVALGFTSIAGV